ncbi:MBOAT, membrane-bound O-acyltransferase family-domain-containing protein [Chytriomyces sp. MP71]|nr:MBOAT, membrane-bound O-acyltransferase family-domain-containing protein [Chytriomyces sp. MP71]
MCLITYALTWALKGRSYMPKVVFGYVMSHFLYRLYVLQVLAGVAEKHIDPATPMMLNVIRLTTFAWYVHDGTLQKEDVVPELQSFSIDEFPDLLEFLGYSFFFATFITGPALDFNSYRSFIRREGVFQKIPSSLGPALRCFLGGALSAATHAVVNSQFTYEYSATVEFGEKFPFWQRFLYVQAAGFGVRAKYYAVFLLAQSACNFVGIGYTGPSPSNAEGIWTRAQNVSVKDVELAQNFKQLFAAWNMKTALWLRNCVYLRMVPRGSKPGAFVTFALGALFPILARRIRAWVRPLFVEPGSRIARWKPAYDFAGWFFTFTSLNCIVAPFVVWDLKLSLQAYHNVGYYAIMWLVIAYVFLEVFRMGKWIRIRGGKAVGIAPPHRRKTHSKEE